MDVRILAASGQDLRDGVSAGTFQSDLLDRLSFDVVHLPPLRIRPEDVQPLSDLFGKRITSELGADRFPGFTPEAMAFLESQPWPGNVRELKNVVERSVAGSFLKDESLSQPITDLQMDPFKGPDWVRTLNTASSAASDTIITSSKLAPTKEVPKPSPEAGFEERVLTFERRLIEEALSLNDHHQGKAADDLNLSYHQFRGLLRKHGLKK